MKTINTSPKVVVIAGPNGAGKSTSAARLLRGTLGVDEFVNADVIARGLSGFTPERVAMAAGRIMLQRLDDLAAQRVNFAFETTLASRTFVPRLQRLIESGYSFHLVFLWLPSADVAVARVAERVRLGGHDVPEATIRRRYAAGLHNLFSLYQPLANKWQIIDNSRVGIAKMVATGRGTTTSQVRDGSTWQQIRKAGGID